MIHPPPRKIVWFYAELQDLYHQLLTEIPNLTFIKDMPSNMEPYLERGNLLIFDDLQTEINPSLCDLFTKQCHHRGISCFLLMQNGLLKGKENRTISLNSHYMVLMKNPRDMYQAQVLARQIMGDKAGKFMEMYVRGTTRPHGYLMVDLKQETPDYEKLKINIFGEDPTGITTVKSALPSHVMTPTVNPTTAYTMRPGLAEASSSARMHHVMRPDHYRRPISVQEEGHIKDEPMGYGSPRGMQHPPNQRKMPSCAHCGAMFGTYQDLQNHERKCEPFAYSSDEEESEPPMKKLKLDTDEWGAWLPIRSQVGEAYKDIIHKKEKKYKKEGYVASNANKMALNDALPGARKDMRALLVKRWLEWHKLAQTPYFKKIEETAKKMRHLEGLSWEEAWSEATRRHKVLFEYILPDREMPDDKEKANMKESEEESSEEEESEEERSEERRVGKRV
jgi:hypothetical protein